jgi:6-phosphogluconolactonase
MKKPFLLVVFTLSVFCSFAQSVSTLKLLVGTYTKKGSEGIYVYDFDLNTGEMKQINKATGIEDPSFLAISPDKKFVYSVCETTGGQAVSYAFDKETGGLKEINRVSSGGVHPCHITIDNTGKWIMIGNYTGGSLSVIPVSENGVLSEPIQTIQHTGKGPNKERQEKPHVHSVNISANNKDVFVPDLGIDEVVAYRFDEASGKLVEGNTKKVSSGSGPRHFTFSPNGKFAYVIQELTGKVSGFKYTDGNLEFIEEVSTLPDNFTGKNSCADIHISPDGKFLYGSNRFYDTLVVFEINQENGKLKQKSQHSVLGKTPRNFVIDPSGKFVLVANQDSDNIVVFKRNSKTGKISPTGKEYKVSMPVCLKFL